MFAIVLLTIPARYGLQTRADLRVPLPAPSFGSRFNFPSRSVPGAVAFRFGSTATNQAKVLTVGGPVRLILVW
jgi:hypothetical protein